MSSMSMPVLRAKAADVYKRQAVEAAVSSIHAQSQKVNGSDEIARVGTVSSGDAFIGKLIAEALAKVSADGVITIEESKTCPLYTSI